MSERFPAHPQEGGLAGHVVSIKNRTHVKQKQDGVMYYLSLEHPCDLPQVLVFCGIELRKLSIAGKR
jgi:hypothetical protein